MKKHRLTFLPGLAVLVVVVGAFAAGEADHVEADAVADAVVLGEVDLADRAEILRNQYRRMTPGDVPLVQDVGTWPAAWEEFGTNWDAVAADRELGTWVVPVEVAREDADTVVLDGNGAELWRGTTDFAKDGTEGVTLTGGLVDEEDWPLYEAARDEIARRLDANRLDDGGGTRGTNGPCTNGLHFVLAESNFTTNPPELRVGLVWTNAATVDVFAYGPLHTSETHVVTYTNDENMVVTWTNTTWHSVEPTLTGYDNAWEWLGTVAVSNTATNVFVATGFPTNRGIVRYYAAAEAVDSDGDGLNDGVEWFVSHSNPENADTDGDGIDDNTEYEAGSSPAVSNAWWVTKTTNDVRYWMYISSNTSWYTTPVLKYATNIIGVSPADTRVVKDVRIDGYVDDAIKADGVFVDFALGPQIFSDRSLTNESILLQDGELHLALYDCPSQGHSGHNEVRLGDANDNPFQVTWEWWVPMDFRLEHINTNGNPLVVNPSGTRPNHEFTCQVTVLPTNIPDSAICWSCTNAGMSFVGGVTNGRTVHLKGTQPGDWQATVTVQSNTLGAATLHGTVLEKKTVPVYLHIVRDNTGTISPMTVPRFQTLLSEVNQLYEQAGIEFQLASNVLYTNKSEWLEISTSDNWAEYGQLQSWSSHTGGIEVYCVAKFEGGLYNGMDWKPSNAGDGLTIVSNAMARTLAHEIGHACGLPDIYVAAPVNNPTNQLPNSLIEQAWISSDWCENIPHGGYGASLTQPELVQRLLMYGVDLFDAVDLPCGSVHGLNRDGGEETLAVGLTGMGNRTPSHW